MYAGQYAAVGYPAPAAVTQPGPAAVQVPPATSLALDASQANAAVAGELNWPSAPQPTAVIFGKRIKYHCSILSFRSNPHS